MEDITTLSIGVAAKLDQFRKDMAQIPGVGIQEARDLAAGIRKELRAAEAASKKASDTAKASAKGTSAAWVAEGNKISAAMAAASGAIGGNFGKVGSVLNGVVRPLAQVAAGAGTAGIALGTAAAAAAGVGLAAAAGVVVAVEYAQAVHALGDAAAAAADRLTKAGQAAEIPPDAIASVAAYKAGQAQLRASTDELLVSAHRAAGVVGLVSFELAKAADAFRTADKSSLAWLDTLNDVNTLGTRRLWQPYVEDLVRVEAETLDVIAATQRAVDAIALASSKAAKLSNSPVGGFVGPTQDMVAPTLTERDAAGAKAVATAEAEIARTRAELLALNQAEIDKTEERREGILRLAASNRAMAGAFAQESVTMNAAIERSIALTEEYAGSWEQVKDVLRNVGQDTIDTMSAVGGTIQGVISDLQTLAEMRIATLEEQAAAEVAADASAAQGWADAENATIDRMEARGDFSEKEADAERARVRDELAAKQAAAQQLANEERVAAMEAFKRAKALAVVQATISAALSSVALIPSFAYAGWWAPGIAASVATAALGVQLAVIDRMSPPEFPTGFLGGAPGGSPDHGQTVRIQPTEDHITSTRATSLLGGRDAIRRANEGRSPGGEGPMIQITLGRRVLAEAVGSTTPSRPTDPRMGRFDHRFGGRR